jgi:hypothetical protein
MPNCWIPITVDPEAVTSANRKIRDVTVEHIEDSFNEFNLAFSSILIKET